MMNWFLFFVFACAFPVPPGTKAIHPLYVSVTDLEWNSKEQTIEITSKIFVDDLQAILQKNYNQKVDLYEAPNELAGMLIRDYCKKNLVIEVNGKSCMYHFIGYERQKEACWCYFEITNISSVTNITCTNSILYDFTDKEMNLVHAVVGENKKSAKLVYPEKKAVFGF
jgi:intergrase/recombinase